MGRLAFLIAGLGACQDASSRDTTQERASERAEVEAAPREVRKGSQEVAPVASFSPGALPICGQTDSPLRFVCDLGREASEVDLGCEAPRVIKACRALVPSFSGHVCSPPPNEDVITLGYVPWESGSLTEQNYTGVVSAIARMWTIEDEAEAARRRQETREQLVAWGCEPVAGAGSNREHFLCGPDWEAGLTWVLGRFTVQVGTTGYFDCRYAGTHGEASRPSRAEW